MQARNRQRVNERVFTYLWLLFVTVVAGYLTWFYKPNYPLDRLLTIAFGYNALGLVAVTLLLGPLKLWRQRQHGRAVRNPVNIYLRRDLGIWAGITGGLHVWYGLKVYFPNQPLFFFLRPTTDGTYTLQTNLFGLSNWAGAVATLLLVLLVMLSFDLLLRRLGGKRWKNLQRLNYFLFGLIVLHTFGYHSVVNRESVFTFGVIACIGLVMVAQGAGIYFYRSYRPGRPKTSKN